MFPHSRKNRQNQGSGGGAYSRFCGQMCARASTLSGASTFRREHCGFLLFVNWSTDARPKRAQIWSTTVRCRIHSPYIGVPLKSKSNPRFKGPGMWYALLSLRESDRSPREPVYANTHNQRRPPWRLIYAIVIVLSILTRTWWPFRNRRKCFRVRKNSSR